MVWFCFWIKLWQTFFGYKIKWSEPWDEHKMIMVRSIFIVMAAIAIVNGNLFINRNVARKEMEEYFRDQIIKALVRINDRLSKEQLEPKFKKHDNSGHGSGLPTDDDREARSILFRVYDSNLEPIKNVASTNTEESNAIRSWLRTNGHPQRGWFLLNLSKSSYFYWLDE